MEVVSSLYNSCIIPGGKAEFTLKDRNLTVKVSVLFESCHCKFERTLTSLKDVIPDLEALVQTDPSNLYKILQEKHIPKDFLTFINLQVPSSKLTQSKGEISPKRNNSDGEAVRKSRSGSLHRKEVKTKSDSDITVNSNTSSKGKTLELKNVPKDSKFLSSDEGTHSKTRRSPRDETSPKERKQRSSSISSSPPDASQGSFTSSDSKSLSPGRVSREEKKANSSIVFDFPLGKGSFDKQTFVFEASVHIEDCKYNFKKNVPTVIALKSEYLKENPSILFEKIFSNHFDPFFKFEKPSLLAQETLSKIYFGHGGIVPPLPPEVEKIWNSTSPLTKQKFCESHTLFLVHVTDIISFDKAIENPIEEQRNCKMQINHSITPDEYGRSAIKCPYWVLIANDPFIDKNITFEEHVNKLKKAGGKSYEASNLIEAALHHIWSRYNKKTLPRIPIKCQETANNKHMIMGSTGCEWEIEIKPGQEIAYKEEGILGVIRFLPLDNKL